MASREGFIRPKHPRILFNYLKLSNDSINEKVKLQTFREGFFVNEGNSIYTPVLPSETTNSPTFISTTPGNSIHPHVISGLGLLILFASVAIIIVIIAVVISKMRRKQNLKKDYDDDVEKSKSRSNSIDPYLQAIIFPSEPRPEWRRYLMITLKNASKKFTGGDDTHRTTIPEHLRHQLKHIYVY